MKTLKKMGSVKDRWCSSVCHSRNFTSPCTNYSTAALFARSSPYSHLTRPMRVFNSNPPHLQQTSPNQAKQHRHFSSSSSSSSSRSVGNLLTIFIFGGMVVGFFGLGTWQLHRRTLKLEAIAEREGSLIAEPVDLLELLDRLEREDTDGADGTTGDLRSKLNFRRVICQGVLHYDEEVSRVVSVCLCLSLSLVFSRARTYICTIFTFYPLCDTGADRCMWDLGALRKARPSGWWATPLAAE